jgi:putative transposase
MAVRREIIEYSDIYFITVTCSRWIRLFEIANAYGEEYKWFDQLKGQGHYILGYVIMPNHIHVLIGFRNTQGVRPI